MKSESNGHGNSFANSADGAGASVSNGPWGKPQESASIWDHLEPPLPR